MDYLYDVSKSIKDLRDTELEIIAKDIKKDKTMAFIAACLIEIRNTNYIQTKTQSNSTPKTHFLNILQKWGKKYISKNKWTHYSLFDIYVDSDITHVNKAFFIAPCMDFDYSTTSFKKTTGTILKNAICSVYENWRGWNSEQLFYYNNYNQFVSTLMIEPSEYSISECLGDITGLVWATYMEDFKKYKQQYWDSVIQKTKLTRDIENEKIKNIYSIQTPITKEADTLKRLASMSLDEQPSKKQRTKNNTINFPEFLMSLQNRFNNGMIDMNDFNEKKNEAFTMKNLWMNRQINSKQFGELLSSI